MVHDVVLITTCTNRKRCFVPDEMHASTLRDGDQDHILGQWMGRLSRNTLSYAASEVYCGRSFKEASLASIEASGELWVISAGLGLVGARSNIPSYSLTITSNSPDNIVKKIIGHKFIPSKWWSGINSNQSPLANFIATNPQKLFVFAISANYIQLVLQDLLSMPDSDLTRIRIIGLSIKSHLDNKLHSFVMPYNERIDGPDGNNAGTRTDFAQRAMRHFVNEILEESSLWDLEYHHYLVNKKLENHRHPPKYNRIRKNDDEILEIIKQNFSSPGYNATSMLRYIRDHENIACEQKRFQQLFNSFRGGASE